LRGKFKLKDEKQTNPLSVGDEVEYEPDPDHDQDVIISDRLERRNFIVRKAVKQSARGHIIAANIDQIMIVATMALPRTSTGFIDRVLASAESFRIPAIIVFNKQDIISEKDKTIQKAMIEIYASIGCESILTSALHETGIEALEVALLKKTTVLTGHSGVGKSSLINVLSKDLELKTGDVSGWSQKGKHTTTFAEMFSLTKDTFIIDTPGIREFGLLDIEDWELADYFPEMRALRNECRYHNCTHTHEPGCIIKRKVDEGEIAESRYLSYLKMIDES
jgi:ribosome biogenesis GTPase